MKRFLFFLLLAAGAAPLAAAQQANVAVTPTYGSAETVAAVNGHFLILSDGVTPNPRGKIYEVNGKDFRFVDEAAILNFLYEQGWEIIPHGIQNGNKQYLLKRRAR